MASMAIQIDDNTVVEQRLGDLEVRTEAVNRRVEDMNVSISRTDQRISRLADSVGRLEYRLDTPIFTAEERSQIDQVAHEDFDHEDIGESPAD